MKKKDFIEFNIDEGSVYLHLLGDFLVYKIDLSLKFNHDFITFLSQYFCDAKIIDINGSFRFMAKISCLIEFFQNAKSVTFLINGEYSFETVSEEVEKWIM